MLGGGFDGWNRLRIVVGSESQFHQASEAAAGVAAARHHGAAAGASVRSEHRVAVHLEMP
jgi:hypothetical protein